MKKDVIKKIHVFVEGKDHPMMEDPEIHADPYRTLIGCLLSLRTKDETSLKVSIDLFKRARNFKELSRMSLKEIEKIIRSVNYYKTKAKRIKEVAEVILKEYKGKVPRSFEELMKLKGVGEKTAAICLMYGFNDDSYIPVDVNVHRIVNRLGWFESKSFSESMYKLMEVVDRKYWKWINNDFVIYGKTVCVPVSPFCSKCVVSKFCKKKGVKKSR